VKFVAVGDIHKKAKSAFIFVHGKGGNRFQGVDDWTFGGNFNRLKNLMARNGGTYLSPHVTSAGRAGVAEVTLLMKEFATYSPGAPIFIGCASNAGDVCWTLASRTETSKLIGGLFLLGATSNISFLSSPAGKDPSRYIPVYLAHGNKDKVIRWQAPEIFYKNVKALRPGYPIRFVVFDGGSHGTPMRMTDWRSVLNWMLSLRR
jgi:pimeloyl-ACP methyl ester carboxylesterase